MGIFNFLIGDGFEEISNPPEWVAEALDYKLGGHGDVVGRNVAHVKGKHFVYRVKAGKGIFGGLNFTYYRKLR